AAVAGAVEAAGGAGLEGVADHRDEGDLRVGGVHLDGAGLAGVAQPDEAPGGAGVGALVDAEARGDVAAQPVRAGGGVDDLRIRRGYPDGAHGGGGQEAVGDVVPAGPGV